jgi:hypothetical protein
MPYTEDHLIEQPAIQLMRHELGWEVANCHGEWNGGVSNQGRDGKREVVLVSRLRPALQRLNPDLPAGAIEGAVGENGILNFECWILNGRGRLPAEPRLNLSFPALSLAEENREIEQSGFPLAVGSLVFKQFP